MRAIYEADTEGVVAVAAAANKVVFGIKADTGHAIDLLGLAFSIDQATPTAADKMVLVEFCYCTWTTQAPGTLSTAVTVDQESGPRVAETFSAAKDWSSTQPTTLTSLRPFDCDPYKFTYDRDFPLGEGPDSAVIEGFALKVTNPAANQSVNVRAVMRWARV